jgi:hypothetical protein
MANSTGSDYVLKKNILSEIAKAAATGGNPDLSTPVTEQGLAEGQAGTQARAFSGEVAAARAKMAESARQTNAKIAMARDYLDTWKKQNTWASAIGTGSVLTAAGSAYVQGEKQQERDLALNKQNATLMDIAKNARDFQAGEIKKYNESQSTNLSGPLPIADPFKNPFMMKKPDYTLSEYARFNETTP